MFLRTFTSPRTHVESIMCSLLVAIWHSDWIYTALCVYSLLNVFFFKTTDGYKYYSCLSPRHWTFTIYKVSLSKERDRGYFFPYCPPKGTDGNNYCKIESTSHSNPLSLLKTQMSVILFFGWFFLAGLRSVDNQNVTSGETGWIYFRKSILSLF